MYEVVEIQPHAFLTLSLMDISHTVKRLLFRYLLVRDTKHLKSLAGREEARPVVGAPNFVASGWSNRYSISSVLMEQYTILTRLSETR